MLFFFSVVVIFCVMFGAVSGIVESGSAVSSMGLSGFGETLLIRWKV